VTYNEEWITTEESYDKNTPVKKIKRKSKFVWLKFGRFSYNTKLNCLRKRH
jgi:hypothetical protein